MARFLEKNVTAAAGLLERTLAAERWSRSDGVLQRLDPRLKIVAVCIIILTCSLARGIPILVVLYLSGFAETGLAVLRLGLVLELGDSFISRTIHCVRHKAFNTTRHADHHLSLCGALDTVLLQGLIDRTVPALIYGGL